MADYLAGVAELPITPDVAPGQIRRRASRSRFYSRISSGSSCRA
jgi:hypothetical protein